MAELKVIVVGGNIGPDEEKIYIDRARNKFGLMVTGLKIMIDHDDVVLSYKLRSNPFERIRRQKT